MGRALTFLGAVHSQTLPEALIFHELDDKKRNTKILQQQQQNRNPLRISLILPKVENLNIVLKISFFHEINKYFVFRILSSSSWEMISNATNQSFWAVFFKSL